MDVSYKREVAVGTLVILAIVLFIVGSAWLSGRSVGDLGANAILLAVLGAIALTGVVDPISLLLLTFLCGAGSVALFTTWCRDRIDPGALPWAVAALVAVPLGLFAGLARRRLRRLALVSGIVLALLVVLLASLAPLSAAAAQTAAAQTAAYAAERLGLKGIRPLAVVDDALVYVMADGVVAAVRLDLGRRRYPPRGRGRLHRGHRQSDLYGRHHGRQWRSDRHRIATGRRRHQRMRRVEHDVAHAPALEVEEPDALAGHEVVVRARRGRAERAPAGRDEPAHRLLGERAHGLGRVDFQRFNQQLRQPGLEDG